MSVEQRIWEFLKSQGFNDYGVAGLMGNLFAESGLIPTNLQNTYNTKFGMTDEEYTSAVDKGSYKNFVHDSAGYGLAQWTYYSRKQNLLDYAKSQGKSIGDLDMQLGFLMKELNSGYKSVVAVLNTATSVLQASNAVLLQFERPANTGTDVQNKRAGYGQTYFNKYAGITSTENDMSLEEFKKLWNEMRRSLHDNDAGSWSKTAREWAVNVGLIAGDGTTVNGEKNYMWEDLLTREQFVTILYRFSQLMEV